jgi:hypothetical protein
MGDLHPFQDLYDAAIRHSAVQITCERCRHSNAFNLAALWWHFNRHGWNDRFAHVRRRLFCLPCWHLHGVKVRPSLAFGDMPPTDTRLPMPSKADWAREARRRR